MVGDCISCRRWSEMVGDCISCRRWSEIASPVGDRIDKGLPRAAEPQRPHPAAPVRTMRRNCLCADPTRCASAMQQLHILVCLRNSQAMN